MAVNFENKPNSSSAVSYQQPNTAVQQLHQHHHQQQHQQPVQQQHQSMMSTSESESSIDDILDMLTQQAGKQISFQIG